LLIADFFRVSWEQMFANLDFRLYHRGQIFTDFLQVSFWYLMYITYIELLYLLELEEM